MVNAARSGSNAGVSLAARCELAVLAYRGGPPTVEQLTGAILRALHHEDTRVIASGKTYQE